MHVCRNVLVTRLTAGGIVAKQRSVWSFLQEKLATLMALARPSLWHFTPRPSLWIDKPWPGRERSVIKCILTSFVKENTVR